jgi:hypothetical protein
MNKIPVHAEVCLRDSCTMDIRSVKENVYRYLEEQCAFFHDGNVDIQKNSILTLNVQNIRIITPASTGVAGAPFWKVNLLIHVYHLSNEGSADEVADEEEEIVAFHLWTLPAIDFEGLWESLYLEANIKERLVSYAASAMLFSDAKVNSHVISCNRCM